MAVLPLFVEAAAAVAAALVVSSTAPDMISLLSFVLYDDFDLVYGGRDWRSDYEMEMSSRQSTPATPAAPPADGKHADAPIDPTMTQPKEQ